MRRKSLPTALAVHGVVEVLRGLAVDRYQRQIGQVGAVPAIGVCTVVRQARRLALGCGRELVRQIVLAQRDLDFHARIGVVAEHLHDLRQRFAVHRRLLDQLGDDDLPGLRLAAHVGRNEDVLADALVLRDEVPDAVVFVDAADDFAVGALRAHRRSRLPVGRACRCRSGARSRDRHAAPCASPSETGTDPRSRRRGTRKPKPSGWPCTVPVTRSSLATTQS